ncbi:MAG: quinoprotein dehydrogenase-associated putative ABC transporter substrate-binding protein [Rhodobacteraceae bacterium]|nr:MAG: quinoprotein dehydrogenase-associated putative ABC transporter substrate-binding protein [Paracoccaceae bacterium]
MTAWVKSTLAAFIVVACALAATPSQAQLVDTVSRTQFRVCSDPANMPFSNDKLEGFENEIAALFAQHFDRELRYFWFPMAMGFVRRTLIENNCDVIIGFAQGDELVLNSNHYYTSTHVLVVPAESALADVTTLSDPRLQGKSLGVVAGSPAASHLAHQNLMKQARGYSLMVDRRVRDPNGEMLRDLIAGEIAAAVMWGPGGGPLTQASDAQFVVTPLLDETATPRLFYRVTMGVRQGEDTWKRELNSAIRRLQPEIDAILRAHGVPLLEDMGTRMKEEAAN